MAYEVFSRRWWRDARRTVPGAGRRTHVAYAKTEEEARAICRAHNMDSDGNRIQRPYGSAYEYESC